MLKSIAEKIIGLFDFNYDYLLGEMTILLSNTAIFMAFVTTPELRQKIIDFYHEGGAVRYIILLIIASAFILSIFHGFTRSEKTVAGKFIMLVVYCYMNIYAGMGLLLYYTEVNTAVSAFTLFLAFINFLNPLGILHYYIKERFVDKSISDEDVRLEELVLGLVILAGMFYILKYVRRAHWSVVYTYCISYTAYVHWITVIAFRKISTIMK